MGMMSEVSNISEASERLNSFLYPQTTPGKKLQKLSHDDLVPVYGPFHTYITVREYIGVFAFSTLIGSAILSFIITCAVIGFDFDLFVWGMFCGGAFIGCTTMMFVLSCVEFLQIHDELT